MIVCNNKDNLDELCTGELYVNEMKLISFHFDIEHYNQEYYQISSVDYNAQVSVVDEKLYNNLSGMDILCIGEGSLEKSFIITEDMYNDFVNVVKPSDMVSKDVLMSRNKSKVHILHKNKKKYLELKLIYEE